VLEKRRTYTLYADRLEIESDEFLPRAYMLSKVEVRALEGLPEPRR
jgi:hypothetical protein